MKKTLMCATAAAAMASAGFVAQAEDGWYGRADVGYVFDGKLDHDAEANSLGSMGGDAEPDGLINGDLGLGYRERQSGEHLCVQARRHDAADRLSDQR